MEVHFISTAALIHRFQDKEQSSSGAPLDPFLLARVPGDLFSEVFCPSVQSLSELWRMLWALQVGVLSLRCPSLYNAAVRAFLSALAHQRHEFAWQTCCVLLCKVPIKTFFSFPFFLLQISFNSPVQISVCSDPFVYLSCRVVCCSQCAYHHGI